MTSTSVRNVLVAGGDVMRYDENAKNLLSEKIVLAWIIKNVVTEAAEMSIREIERNIGDDILISKIRVEPGLSNLPVEEQWKEPPRISGDNTESKVPGEGAMTYDIRCSFWIPKRKELVKLLLNVEAQNDFYPGYPLVTRGIFYAGRMISAQLETEIVDSNYQDMKKVYSIWICMNAPDYIGNAITRYDLGKKDVFGETPDHVEDYDKINVSMIYLNQKKDSDDDSIFHFLNTLLSETHSVDEKMRVLEEKFEVGISEETGLRKELNTMCNLGEGLVKRSEKRGEERGEKRGEKRGEERGEKRGVKLGEDRINELTQKLLSENRMEDLKRGLADRGYQKKLMQEYQIS